MRRTRRRIPRAETWLLSLAFVGVGVAPGCVPAAAQEPERARGQEADVAAAAAARVEAARRLVAAGDTAAAIDSLRAYLADYPADGGTQWLLARYLVDTGQVEAAAFRYSVALAAAEDPWLRLEYAELRLTTGEFAAAMPLLEPLLAPEAPPWLRAPALTLAGTADYWAGDLSRAARRFTEALSLDAGQPDARRRLDEIRAATRSWAMARTELLDDDQPFRRYRATVEGGTYLTPLWTLALGVAPRLLDPAPGSAATSRSGAASGWVEAAGSVPRAGLRLRGRVGAWVQGGQSSDPAPGRAPVSSPADEPAALEWLAAGEVVYGLPLGLSARTTVSRDRYLATVSSADTLVVVRSLELAVGRAGSDGLAGEALGRVEAFPDGNVVRTAYVWALVPVLPPLRLGYAGSWQDADESRWTAVDPPDPAGRYAPYYTPEQVVVHAVLGEVAVGVGPVTVRSSGRYGFAATERAPAIDALGVVTFYDRDFHPWSARAALTWTASPALRVQAAAEHQAMAFWEETRVGITLHARLGRGAVGP